MSKTFEQFKVKHEALTQEGLDLGFIGFNHDGAIEYLDPAIEAQRKEEKRAYREQLKAEREAEFNKLWEPTPNETKEAMK